MKKLIVSLFISTALLTVSSLYAEGNSKTSTEDTSCKCGPGCHCPQPCKCGSGENLDNSSVNNAEKNTEINTGKNTNNQKSS